jgi:hypothetical protein
MADDGAGRGQNPKEPYQMAANTKEASVSLWPTALGVRFLSTAPISAQPVQSTLQQRIAASEPKRREVMRLSVLGVCTWKWPGNTRTPTRSPRRVAPALGLACGWYAVHLLLG